MFWLVTVSHQEDRPNDRMTLAPPDRKSKHTLSSTVRKDENRVLRGDTCGRELNQQVNPFLLFMIRMTFISSFNFIGPSWAAKWNIDKEQMHALLQKTLT